RYGLEGEALWQHEVGEEPTNGRTRATRGRARPHPRTSNHALARRRARVGIPRGPRRLVAINRATSRRVAKAVTRARARRRAARRPSRAVPSFLRPAPSCEPAP